MSILVAVEGLDDDDTLLEVLNTPDSGFKSEGVDYGRRRRYSYLGDGAVVLGEIVVIAKFAKTIMQVFRLNRGLNGKPVSVIIKDKAGKSVTISASNAQDVEKLLAALDLASK